MLSDILDDGGSCQIKVTLCHYRPQRSCEGYVFTSVCLSTGGSTWPGTPPPGTRYNPPCDQVPPGTRYPPPRDQVHPRTRYTLRDQVHPPDQVSPQTRYTPLPCDQVPPPDQVHPPRDQVLPTSCPEHRKMGDTVNVRTVRILLECIFVFSGVCNFSGLKLVWMEQILSKWNDYFIGTTTILWVK